MSDSSKIAAYVTEVTATEARIVLADLIDAAQHHGRPTNITRRGKVVAKLVGPDAGRMPDPDLWQAAQEAYDALNACDLSPNSRRILSILGTLLSAYYGYEETT